LLDRVLAAQRALELLTPVTRDSAFDFGVLFHKFGQRVRTLS
jgi:hypothetical protein